MTELEKKSFSHAIGLLESFKETPNHDDISKILIKAGVDEKKQQEISAAIWHEAHERAAPAREAFEWLKTVRKSIK